MRDYLSLVYGLMKMIEVADVFKYCKYEKIKFSLRPEGPGLMRTKDISRMIDKANERILQRRKDTGQESSEAPKSGGFIHDLLEAWSPTEIDTSTYGRLLYRQPHSE